MKFLLDANIPYSSLKVFEALDLEAVHVYDINLGSAEDSVIMKYAAKNELVIVTRDLDFGALAVHTKVPAYGILSLRLPFSFTAKQINSILKSFLSNVELDKLKRAVVVVELGRYRIRKL